MKINQLTVQNFRGFENTQITLDPQFNVIIGDNGSGKTALLEALTIAIGSFFLGIKDTDSRNIRRADVRLKTFENSEEFQFPVLIKATGTVNNEHISWQRELNSLNGNTLYKNALSIKKISENIDICIRSGKDISLPILAYYSTGRLWKDLVEREFPEKESTRVIASRLRGYKGSLQAISTFKLFLKWFKSKELSSIQKREIDFSLSIIKKLLITHLPNCSDLYYEFDQDKIEGLKIKDSNASILPFEYLSDGTRNMLALIADIAYRCILLNPHLKENALFETEGIILIDELDLHLHPEWQKILINALKNSFPKVQFITSSHSPFVIQEMEEGQLLILKNNQVQISGASQLSIEDIAEFKQEVDNPQWSIKKQELYNAATQYLESREQGAVNIEQEILLNNKMLPFTQDPTFSAFMNQVLLVKKANNNESGN